MTKPKVKALAAQPVPQTRAAVVAAIAEIGQLVRDRTRIEADLNDQVAALKQAAEEKALPLAQRIAALTEGVQTWCEAHRDELTQGGKTKTATLSSGEVRWRVTPPKVVVRGMEAVLDALRRAGLTRFIRTKEELNKDVILAEPEAVAGIRGLRIEQVEEFVVVPFETALEEVPS
jgi:phage host-nuclease inhibitor protein Gam